MRIILTLTNIQIVRNYLFDKELDILRNLVYSEIIIICNEATFDSVKKHISSYSERDQLKIRILLFRNSGERFIILRILDSIAKSHISSKFALNKIFRAKSKNEITWAKLFLRVIVYILTFKNRFSSVQFRFFYSKLYLHLEDFSRLQEFKDCDIALTLSLTDDLDTYIAGFCKKNNIKNIGTVRSWDNLTSHGLLRIKPDVFYCHSQAMLEDLIKFQHFNRFKDSIVVGHSYWINFTRINDIALKSQPIKFNVLFGSMGLYFNPSEVALLSHIYQLRNKLVSSQVNFTVLMHPKFGLPVEVQKEFSDFITFETFNFDNHTEIKSYSEYLEYLSEFNLILSSGSTLLLDASLVNQNIAHINFELLSVRYWESIKRYLDFREYYEKFLDLGQTPIINSIEEFEKFILAEVTSKSSGTPNSSVAWKYILGEPENISLVDFVNKEVC